jgi:leucyl-tRNA synthetase
MKRYNPSEIEPKWQKIWEDKQTYVAKTDTKRQKLYVSGMFPYPSGAGMHTGHAFSYSIVDAIARFYRQHGDNVLSPMGWDTFGLPAENYAIKTGRPPAETTIENINNFKHQFKRMGVSIDWSREISTSDPNYYRWTQWIFTKLFERGLAYQKESLQWWCPVDKTVLANEQVEGGRCWRCGSLVEKKSMKQWFFKITEYADRLLDEIPNLDWPQKIKVAQTNWIGRSVGAEIEFKVGKNRSTIKVFTTRPDTLFGATFLVLAPEHKLVSKITTKKTKKAVETYVKSTLQKSDIERQENQAKTGVFTGSYAVNPATGENIPIWLADYVLAGYGSGAIMAVPAHDERDFAFANKFHLPIKQVIMPFGIDASNPPSQEFDMVKRSTVIVHLRDKSSGHYALLEWHETLEGIVTAIMGGIEKSETPEAAALREIEEEAGLTNVKILKISPWTSAAAYCAFHKKENRKAIARVVLAEVDSSSSTHKVVAKETKNHTLIWVPEDKVYETLTPAHQRLVWEMINTDGVHVGEGELINSSVFDGIPSSDAREQIVDWLEKQGIGSRKTTYKVRDWLISRQRYWGAPIPIIHCPKHGAVPVPDNQLPVILPEVDDYVPKGNGKSVLAKVTNWVETTCPICGAAAKRETDTMDGYACSSWYLLRYTDPFNQKQAWAPKKVNYWAPLDYYIGGDHAVAHLLYVRFWTHVFKDMGLTNFAEPVKKLVYHGYVNAEDGSKMSKSKGNVVDPLEVINQGYGADALRIYLLFMGPIELDSSWDPRGVAGTYRFLNRVWVLVQEFLTSNKIFKDNDKLVQHLQHKTVLKVTDDYLRLSFNTAIATLMELTNSLYKLKADGFSTTWRQTLSILVQLLAPIAPHISQELWQQLGHQDLIEQASWPEWDEMLAVDETMTIVVQVNGKLRATLKLPKNSSEKDIKDQALTDERIVKIIDNKKPTRLIYIPNRLINIVAV